MSCSYKKSTAKIVWLECSSTFHGQEEVYKWKKTQKRTRTNYKRCMNISKRKLNIKMGSKQEGKKLLCKPSKISELPKSEIWIQNGLSAFNTHNTNPYIRLRHQNPYTFRSKIENKKHRGIKTYTYRRKRFSVSSQEIKKETHFFDHFHIVGTIADTKSQKTTSNIGVSRRTWEHLHKYQKKKKHEIMSRREIRDSTNYIQIILKEKKREREYRRRKCPLTEEFCFEEGSTVSTKEISSSDRISLTIPTTCAFWSGDTRQQTTAVDIIPNMRNLERKGGSRA